jgi:hypothetical protein
MKAPVTVEIAIHAAQGAAMVDGELASGGRLRDLVVRCLDLDSQEERSASRFCLHLRATITNFRLGRLFAWDAEGEHPGR